MAGAGLRFAAPPLAEIRKRWLAVSVKATVLPSGEICPAPVWPSLVSIRMPPAREINARLLKLPSRLLRTTSTRPHSSRKVCSRIATTP